ncbi:TPA_asm: holin [Salmonella enterica]|nr:holin [Salmonella enterica]HAS2179700.1 holin [Salmonella enterica subsp. enterica]
MRDFLLMAQNSFGGATVVGTFTGEFLLAIATFILFAIFGCWGAWLKWRDSKAIREALDSGDLKTALNLRQKERV